MEAIPLKPVASQITRVVLAAQNCQIYLYQKEQGLFFDLNVNGIDIVSGVIARDMVPLVCREYLGFAGNLIFVDSQGAIDPVYTGLGSRFELVYLTADEYALMN